MADGEIIELLKYVITFLGGGFAFAIVIFLYPEKVERWGALFWKIASIFKREYQKKYIAHDIQARVNEFTNKKLVKLIKNYEPVGIEIKWIEQGESPREFFNDNKVIIRMHKSESQNKNIIGASMAFISQALLKEAKRYISESQKESIDLFVAKKLFEKEKTEIVDQFVQDFLFEKTETNEKISRFFEKYNLIDKAGLFFPVFIQEMTFLGKKVFGQRKDEKIVKEVNDLIDFLELYSKREIGEEEIKKNFEGLYCRFAMMIIAKAEKVLLGDIEPFIRYIEKLNNRQIENIYIIGPTTTRNVDFISQVSNQAINKFNLELYDQRNYEALIRTRRKKIRAETHLVILRSLDSQIYFDVEDQIETI